LNSKKIGLARSNSKFEFYRDWLNENDIDHVVLDYDKPEEGFKDFENCSGLILTGGADIYPEVYCDWDTSESKGSYLPHRDGFDLKLLRMAIEEKKPVLGICRGLQLINIYFRGSLIFDLEEIRGVNHKRVSDTEDRIHDVKIFNGTILHDIIKREELQVNSSHHQSADRIGEGLIISAKSTDGVVEGLEYEVKDGKNFLIAVQWHPERMKDRDDPASKNVLQKFLEESNKWQS
jgi:putative glutamine amidotransferase